MDYFIRCSCNTLIVFIFTPKKNKCNSKYPLFTMHTFCYLFNYWYLCIKLTSLGSFFIDKFYIKE